MRHLIAVAALVAAGSVQAATIVVVKGPAVAPLVTETVLLDFNAALPAGATLTGGTAFYAASVAGIATSPNGTGFISTIGTGSIVFDLGPIRTFSFFFGTPDSYNGFSLLDENLVSFQTVTGSDLVPATGQGRVFVTLAADETLGGIGFSSSSPAFEIDDIALAVVPEPATWGLMIAGFALVGTAARRRRTVAA